MQISTQCRIGGDILLSADADQTLFWEGDACAHVFEVRSGVIRGVSISEEGERQVTAFFFSGDEIGIPLTETCRYSAETVTPVSYVRHAQGRWCDTMIDSFRRTGRFMPSISTEQDSVYRRGTLIGRSGVVSRVAAFLTLIIDRLEPLGAGFYFPLPQIDIAAYLAVSPETVCRSLKQLRKLAIIEMPSHDRLIIADRSRLERAAHGFPV